MSDNQTRAEKIRQDARNSLTPTERQRADLERQEDDFQIGLLIDERYSK